MTHTTNGMQGRDFLCFSHDWTGDPLSKTHLMRLAAQAGNRVLWVNSIGYRTPSITSGRDMKRAFAKLAAAADPLREVEPNIFVLSPLFIPAYRHPLMQTFNRSFLRAQVRRALRRLGFQRPINWVFNPAAALIAGQLGEETVLYYCVDEYTAFSGVPTQSLIEMEHRLLCRADLVIVSAENLLHAKRAYNANIHLVRHGVDFDHFNSALSDDAIIPDEIARLPRPILGYFGLMAHDWFDIDLLIHVARAYPHGSLVLLGKATMDLSRLTALPNVHALGRKTYAALPAYCKGFDVALIPFPINDVTLHSNPLKAREYLAAGLPVVSTAIPEVEVLGQCRIAHTPDTFVAEIAQALMDPGPAVYRSNAVRADSWQARYDHIISIMSTCDAPPGMLMTAPASAVGSSTSAR